MQPTTWIIMVLMAIFRRSKEVVLLDAVLLLLSLLHTATTTLPPVHSAVWHGEPSLYMNGCVWHLPRRICPAVWQLRRRRFTRLSVPSRQTVYWNYFAVVAAICILLHLCGRSARPGPPPSVLLQVALVNSTLTRSCQSFSHKAVSALVLAAMVSWRTQLSLSLGCKANEAGDGPGVRRDTGKTDTPHVQAASSSAPPPCAEAPAAVCKPSGRPLSESVYVRSFFF